MLAQEMERIRFSVSDRIDLVHVGAGHSRTDILLNYYVLQKRINMAAKIEKPLTKTQIIANIAGATGLDKKQVAAVLDELCNQIAGSLAKKGPGSFTLPGLLKIEKKLVPAQKARKGVKNPFTGEIRDVPAKPAHNKIKIKALKALKEMA